MVSNLRYSQASPVSNRRISYRCSPYQLISTISSITSPIWYHLRTAWYLRINNISISRQVYDITFVSAISPYHVISTKLVIISSYWFDIYYINDSLLQASIVSLTIYNKVHFFMVLQVGAALYRSPSTNTTSKYKIVIPSYNQAIFINLLNTIL